MENLKNYFPCFKRKSCEYELPRRVTEINGTKIEGSKITGSDYGGGQGGQSNKITYFFIYIYV